MKLHQQKQQRERDKKKVLIKTVEIAAATARTRRGRKSHLTTVDAERVQAEWGVADQEECVEDAEDDEELVEGAAHLGAPQDDGREQVAHEAEQAQHGGEDSGQPELPAYQILKKKEDIRFRFLKPEAMH